MIKSKYLLLMTMIISILSSCKQGKKAPEDMRFKVENLSWEENSNALGVKIAVSYPIGDDILSSSIREWINETLGGTCEYNLIDGDSVLMYYGKKKAEEALDFFKEINDPQAEFNSCCYIQIKKVFETKEFVSFTYEVYEYSGGAHGSEVKDGGLFRKSDGRRFDWDIFTDNGKEALRSIIKEELKTNYFKVSTDEEFYSNIFVENATYQFPLPSASPIFKRDGVTFIYQQYEITAYALGMPQVTLPYERIIEFCTHAGKTMIKSTNDDVAKTLPYGSNY